MSNNKYFNVIKKDWSSINIIELTASTVYNKPSNLHSVKIICVGGGGGGGAGRGQLGQMLGGSGGGGGSLTSRVLSSDQLATDETITIGAGGSGGNAFITNGASDGDTGGTTSFGSLVIAVGGEGGKGAFVNPLPLTVNGGNRTLNTPKDFPNSIAGGISGRGSSNGNAPVTTGLNTGGYSCAGVGGGGGGGHNVSFNNANGGRGGVVMNKDGTEFSSNGGGGSSGGAGEDGVDDISLFEAEDGQISTIGIGTGGGGGGNASDDINYGGNGGNGGRGSGGGASGVYKSGVLPQIIINGGNGGNGFCIIFEYLK